MPRSYALSIVAFALFALVAACGVDSDDQRSGDGDGTFAGTVTIGPLCPVEPCDPPAGTPHAVRDLVLQRPGGIRIEVPLDDDGSFSAEVPAGTYTVHLTNCHYLGCATAFPEPGTTGAEPATVTIVAGQTTTRDFEIDTGIRRPAPLSRGQLAPLSPCPKVLAHLCNAGEPLAVGAENRTAYAVVVPLSAPRRAQLAAAGVSHSRKAAAPLLPV